MVLVFCTESRLIDAENVKGSSERNLSKGFLAWAACQAESASKLIR
jgi:hypothetical protein